MLGTLQLPTTVVDAWRGETVRLAGARVSVPGSRRIRLAVVAGNLRIHRLLDRFVRSGDRVVDVGANVGYNTLHAARLVGPTGRVVAIEPTPDNLEVLRHNVAAAGFANVDVRAVAVGRVAGTGELYVRGERSAVNSLFRESCYATVTAVLRVPVVPLDELVEGRVDVVKIDVEGAELDVLEGMTGALRGHPPRALIVEWHPLLQTMAGYSADELPRWLLEREWQLSAVSHTTVRVLHAANMARLTARLLRARRPVELLAQPSIPRRRG